jgi:polysaccharide export outer membrane protein
MLMAALALTACTSPRARYAPQGAAAVRMSELDKRLYGVPQPSTHVQPRPAYVQQRSAYVAPPRQSYVVRRVVQVMPVQAEDGPYTLDTGDKLRIVVFGQDALSNTYIVNAEGMISLPLVGNVGARGLTTEQLAGAVASRLKQSYIREPSVAAEVEVYRPFFVLGEVTYPGQYPFVPNMTVENAIAIAGGFTPRAYKDKVTITRKQQGVPHRVTLPLRYPLRPGDTIEVAERWF